MKPVALITGITGQDGSYLAEFLLDKNYEVHGVVRHVAMERPQQRLWRIEHLLDRVHLHAGSLENYASLFRVVHEVMPDEIYHLAATSYVAYSFEDQFSTMQTNINGTHFMLAAMRELVPRARFYFAGSSEMFGKVAETPQSEMTPFHPRSPYGISKVAGYHLTRNYREAYYLFACCGILYNHESPRRGAEFVTRKITLRAAEIKLGLANELRLGNLDAMRDWGHAREYVRAMWLMLQRPNPDDFVISSGTNHAVREWAEVAFRMLGLDAGKYVVTDPHLMRPAEVDVLLGDCSKARKELAWNYQLPFEGLIKEMIEADLESCKNQRDFQMTEKLGRRQAYGTGSSSVSAAFTA